MALYNIPPLPEGLHPYISIMTCESYESYSKRKTYLITGDASFTKTRINSYGYEFNNVCYFVLQNNKWERLESKLKVNDSYIEVMYANCDIKSEKKVIYEKTPDAVSIEIEGGNTRTLKKGMIWDLRKAVSISPVNAFQDATFESSNKSVCTVDEDGHLVAVGEGDCIITITSR